MLDDRAIRRDLFLVGLEQVRAIGKHGERDRDVERDPAMVSAGHHRRVHQLEPHRRGLDSIALMRGD